MQQVQAEMRRVCHGKPDFVYAAKRYRIGAGIEIEFSAFAEFMRICQRLSAAVSTRTGLASVITSAKNSVTKVETPCGFSQCGLWPWPGIVTVCARGKPRRVAGDGNHRTEGLQNRLGKARAHLFSTRCNADQFLQKL